MGRKEIRQKQLLQLVLERGGIPSTSELASAFNVSQRTIQNDLDEIIDLIPDMAVKDINRLLMLELNKRVPEMRDGDLIRLAGFFLSKKIEANVESSGFRVEIVDNSKDDRVQASSEAA